MFLEAQTLGKVLIFIGAAILLIGILLFFFEKIPYLGKLPGDIFIQKGQFTFYFPIVTSILISIITTVILSLIKKKPFYQ